MQHHIQNVIRKYNLIPHPEGGYYREVYRSGLRITSPTINKERTAATHIYYFLMQDQISRFHKIVHDEIWNFYEGDALKLITFDGQEIKQTLLGIKQKAGYTLVVPAECYMAAETSGEYSLVGCTVAPGFEFEDMSYLSDDKTNKEKLLTNFSEYKKFI
jgi:predicted cupin superfamily sugar epimerase